jgi:multicomponent Na+:H+ antiporter subunit A
MLTAVLSGFVLSLAAPWLQRIARGATGWLLALLPLGLFIYFASFIPAVAAGQVFTVSHLWVPSLGVNLSFYLDGLSLTFALLISGIGALVVVYAGGYLAGDERSGRLYLFLLMFMASMLGLALTGNLITFFIFWELTSVSSYLLIGFDHERDEARAAALQALLVTSLGGLALLAGLVMLGLAGGSYELSALLGRGEVIRSHPLYLPMLLLVLLGAFTKSAQFPFHFWLPGAMEAPAPVSAYLHSATMVNAGVYLLARLTPVLGGADEWHYIVTITGAVTMLVGAAMAMAQTDLKRLLAYSTVSALGTLTLLIGLGTTPAIKAAMVFLLVHSLYKGALFLVTGSLDHEAGTRDVERLGGLRRAMPITAAAAILAALSMAGLPPLFGFVSKELLYEAKLQAPQAAWLITGAGMLANVIMVSLGAVIALRPFFGRERETPKEPHEAPPSMLLGPALLALMGLILGLAPDTLAAPLVSAAVSAARAEPTEIKLALWHGLNPILILSVATVAGGACLYLLRGKLYWLNRRLHIAAEYGPARWYSLALDGVMALAKAQTRVLQNGYLRVYLLIVISTTLGLAGFALFGRAKLTRPETPLDVRSYEWIIAAVILGATIATARTLSRLTAVAALGVVGFGIALIYILYGAPDLAKTQFAVETLTVVLFVLVLYRLPRFGDYTGKSERARDLVVALATGGFMTALLLAVVAVPRDSRLAAFFAENSAPLAKGRNIVNVILVDFRGLDTLGEITVLSVAAIGVFALLRLRLGGAKNQ